MQAETKTRESATEGPLVDGLRHARAQIEAGELEAARATLESLGQRFPGQVAVYASLAELERRCKAFGRAADHLVEVERLGRLTPPMRLLRAQFRVQDKDHAAALPDFQALNDDPAHQVDALAGLSCCLAKLKRHEEARQAARRMLAIKPFTVRKAKEPKGCILVLEALYMGYVDRLASGDSIYTPLNVVQSLVPQELDLCHLYVDAPDMEEVLTRLPPVDVIYNNVVNAELANPARYGPRIERIVERLGVPILNPPAVVAETTRRRNYERLSQIPGLIFPATLEAVVPEPARCGAFAEWLSGQVGLPLLVRRTHSHADEDVAVFRDAEALEAWAKTRTGLRCYFIRFVDFRSADGLYRKYRAAAINGRLFPVHLFFGRNAVVHRNADLFRELVAETPSLIDEVYGFLYSTDEVLDESQMEALQRLIEIVGLDFLGIDFGILPGGTLVVFEANASMMARSFYPEMYDRLADLMRSDREILRYLERYCANKVALGRRPPGGRAGAAQLPDTPAP